MLDRERADFFRALGQLQEQLSERCVAVHLPIGSEHELTGIVDVLHMCAYTSPDGGKEGEPGPIPDGDDRARSQEYREKLLDEVVQTDEALMESYLEGGELGVEEVAHALKDAVTRGEVFPVACGDRDEEPRHARAARPDRRGRALAGEGRLDHAHRGRRAPPRSSSRRSPTRSPGGSTSSASSRARSPPTRRSSTRARTRRSGWARSSFQQGKEHIPAEEFGPGDIGAVAKLKEVQTGDLLLDREVATDVPEIGFPEPVMSFADHAEGEGRRGEGRERDPPARRGGPDPPAPPRPADRRGDPLGHEPDARRGRARARQAALRRRRRAAPAARAVPRDDPLRVAGPRALQEADGRPRPVRRLPHRARADRGPRRLRVRRQDRRRRDPAELPAGRRQGHPGGDGARRARGRARAGRARPARRRLVPQRRLLRDGVQDRRLDGVQGRLQQGEPGAARADHGARGDRARRGGRRGQRRPQLAARPAARDGAGERHDDDQGRGADGRAAHLRAVDHLAHRRPRRLLDALPPLRGGAAHVAQKVIEDDAEGARGGRLAH